MKKKLVLFLILCLVLSFFSFYVVLAGETTFIESSCDALFTPQALSLIKRVLGWIQMLAPIALIVFLTIDFGSIVISTNPDEQSKKAIGRGAKRIIATICIFLIVVFVRILLSTTGFSGFLSYDPLCSEATGTEASNAVTVAIPDPVIESPSRPQLPGKPGQISVPQVVIPNGNSSSGGNITTGNGGSGYSHTITFGGKKYKIYKQCKYTKYKFWDGNMCDSGCGPTSVAIVASGYGLNVDPVAASKKMSYGSLDQVKKALTAFGINASSPKIPSGNGKVAINDIRSHLAKGKPVIVLVGKSKTASPAALYTRGGHFMVLLGEKNGKLVIGNPSGSSSTGTIENMVQHYMMNATRSGRGYLLIQS